MPSEPNKKTIELHFLLRRPIISNRHMSTILRSFFGAVILLNWRYWTFRTIVVKFLSLRIRLWMQRLSSAGLFVYIVSALPSFSPHNKWIFVCVCANDCVCSLGFECSPLPPLLCSPPPPPDVSSAMHRSRGYAHKHRRARHRRNKYTLRCVYSHKLAITQIMTENH